jgi:uncharacterized protein involved in exopolysaccharide biosynthesis
MTEQTENKKATETDEIDLIEVFKKIKAGKRTIYKTIAVFFVWGLIIAFGTPKEYKSETTLLIETSSKNGMSGLLQQFGGLAGLNFGNSSDQGALNPELYPYVIKSTPFMLEVMNVKVTESKYDSTLTVAQYIDRHTKSSAMSFLMDYTIGLPGKIMGWIKGKPKVENIPLNWKGPFGLTQKQSDMAKSLADCITTKEGDAKGTLVLSVEMQDPLVAAQLTDSVVKCLTKYVVDYHTQKAKTDLQFITDRHDEAETRYINAQKALAAYRDQNKNVILASAKSEEERLQAEYNLAFNVYNALSQQLEQAKIKVQEETPVFKVLNPAQVPLQKSKPKTSLVLISMLLFGGIIGIGIVFSKIIYRKYKLL